jgi:hypothetical protein
VAHAGVVCRYTYTLCFHDLGLIRAFLVAKYLILLAIVNIYSK